MPIEQLWKDLHTLHGLPGDGSIPSDWVPFGPEMCNTRMRIEQIRSSLKKLKAMEPALEPKPQSHPDDELGKFLYEKYTTTWEPMKTIREQAKKAGFTKPVSSDPAALKIVDAYCDRHHIDKPRRKKRRIKPD
jgi:hypothetical protein